MASNHLLNTFEKNKWLFIVAGLVMAIAVAGMIFIGPQFQNKDKEPVVKKGEEVPQTEIIMWGLWDESSVIDELANSYQSIDPTIKITYKKVAITDYEKELVQALAEDRGPDIFAIHHTWPYQASIMNLAQPMPDSVMTLDEYYSSFVKVVPNDFIKDEKIWGFPLFIDTLAFFYNKDLYYIENIQDPPTTWEEVQNLSKQLTKIDLNGNIVQAGITMGAGANIARSPDIISLLMLQGGIDLSGTIQYREGSEITKNYLSSAENVLKFYTDFANPRSTLYTWNLAQNYSLDVFAQKRAAMMIGYGYHIEQLATLSPRLNYGVSKIPQISDDPSILPVNYANYWGYTVAKRSQNSESSYKFLKFLTSKEASQKYFELTKRVSPRIDLVNTIKQDPTYGVFADQILTAQSWKQPNNYEEDKRIVESIDSILKGEQNITDSVSEFVK